MYYRYRQEDMHQSPYLNRGIEWKPESQIYYVGIVSKKLLLPIREVNVNLPHDPYGRHRINAVYLGGDEKTPSSWMFFDPRTDRCLTDAVFAWGAPGNMFIIEPEHDIPLDYVCPRAVRGSYADCVNPDLSKPLPVADLPVFKTDDSGQMKKLDIFLDESFTRALIDGDADQFSQCILSNSRESTQKSHAAANHIYSKAYHSGQFSNKGLKLIHDSIRIIHENPESWNNLSDVRRRCVGSYMEDRGFYRKVGKYDLISNDHRVHRDALKHLSSIKGLLTDGEKQDYLNAIEHSGCMCRLVDYKDPRHGSRDDQNDAILEEAYKSDVLTPADKLNLYQAERLFRRIEGGFNALPEGMYSTVWSFFFYRREFTQSFGDSIEYHNASAADLTSTHKLLNDAGILKEDEEKAFRKYITEHPKIAQL